MASKHQHLEYRRAVKAAKDRFLPVFQSRVEKARAEKAERLEERAEFKTLCQKVAPGVVSSIEILIVAKNKDLEGLGSLEYSEETQGYLMTDDCGNLLEDENGKNITDDEWLIGANLYFVPYGAGSVADVVISYRKTWASMGDDKKVSTEAPSQYEIDQANFARSTAALTLFVTPDRGFLIALDIEESESVGEESQYAVKPNRIKDAEYCEYHDIDSVDHQFLDQQIERFLIVCLGDSKIVDLSER
jgi:hypothetical protein